MIFELQTAIKNKLDEIDNFKAVYDHFTLKNDGYPYAAFELSSFGGEELTVCTNERTFSFNIIIIQEVNKKRLTRDQSKNIVYKCLEQIVEKFDGEQDLGEGTVMKGNVVNGDMGTIEEKEGSIIALNVKLDLTVLSQVNQ